MSRGRRLIFAAVALAALSSWAVAGCARGGGGSGSHPGGGADGTGPSGSNGTGFERPAVGPDNGANGSGSRKIPAGPP